MAILCGEIEVLIHFSIFGGGNFQTNPDVLNMIDSY
jgi:hypothetical protein